MSFDEQSQSSPGATDIRSNADQSIATADSGSTGCKFCQRTGFAILPLRYAAVPRFVRGHYDVFASMPNLGEHVKDKRLQGHSYALRTLRAGFVYVYLNTPGRWQGYVVSPMGYLRQMIDLDAADNKTDREMTKVCQQNGDTTPASFIRIRDIAKTPKVWLAFSQNQWTAATRKHYEKNPALRMQMFDCAALATTPNAQPHALEIPATAGNFNKLVDEYAATAVEAAERRAYTANDPITGKNKNLVWDSVHGNYDRSNQTTALGKFVASRLQKTAGKQKVPAVVLFDPVGILQEINGTRLHSIEVRQDYCQAPQIMRPLLISQSILGLKQIIEASSLQKRTAEEAKNKLPDVQTDYPLGDPMGAMPAPDPVTTTRAERAAVDAADIWARLAQRYNEGQRKAFEDKHAKTMSVLQNWIGYGGHDWAAWADAPEWKGWFGDYDPQRVEDGLALIELCAPCLAGGPAEDADSLRVWKKWVEAKPDAKDNPIYTALFGDRKDLISYLAPVSEPEAGAEAEPKLGKKDKLYDTVKALIGSEQGEHAIDHYLTEPIRKAIAQIQLAIAGATSKIGKGLSAVGDIVANRAQQAAMLLYSKTEVTLLKLRMTVGDYLTLLQTAAFSKLTGLERQLDHVVSESGRTVRSMALAGLLGINDPLVRGKVIQITLWTLENAADLKRQIEQLAKSAKQDATAAIVGATAAAAAAAGSIRLASATLCTEAAAQLGLLGRNIAVGSHELGALSRKLLTGTVRVGGSREFILAAGAIYLQQWAFKESVKSVETELKLKDRDWQLSLLSAGVGVVGATVEAAGAGFKALSYRAAGKVLIKAGGAIASVASIVDGVQCVFSAIRTAKKGDANASTYYSIAAFAFISGGLIGAYAAIAGASTLLGPFGIALGLIVIGVIAAWAALNAESTQAEIWLDRCYFGYGKRGEGKWSDKQIDHELAELNAIIVGLSAKVGYNDDWLGLSELFTSFETISVKIRFPNFDPARSRYEWKVMVYSNDGKTAKPMFGEYPHQPQQSYVSANVPVAAKDVMFRNAQTSERFESGAWAVDDSVEARTSVYNKLRFEARYWPDRDDVSGKAELTMEDAG